jgi:hypothetical protein
MLFIATRIDKARSTENRRADLSYLNGSGRRLKIDGAMPGSDYQTPIGSPIFAGGTREEVFASGGKEPFSLAALFENSSIGVKPWRQGFGQPLA